MAIVPYPSIDSGFIYDPARKLDCILTDFYESEHAQSYLFKSEISSLPYILQQYANDAEATTNSISNTLRTMLLRYFDDCEITCRVQDTGSATTYDIVLALVVTQEGQSVELHNLLKISDTKLSDVLKRRQ